MSTARGRRPGGPDTRGEILAAARAAFATKGYGATSMRGVAAEAGVDPALVHHYFDGKDGLFLASLEVPVDPRELVPRLVEEGIDGAGERMLRTFLAVWDDPVVRLPLLTLVRTSLGAEGPVDLLRDGMFRLVFTPLADALAPVVGEPEAHRRVQLVASQLIGLVVARYLLVLEPLASLSTEEVVARVGPTLQRYFDGVVAPARG